jgi:RNA polymerase sigma factor for flagellar operon FliA
LRNRLVEMYLPLVKYNGERIWSRLPEGVELDDLISAGVFGLMDAIDAFDLGAASSSRPTACRASAGPCSTSCGPWTGCRGWCAPRPASWNEAAKRSKPSRPPPTDRAGRAARRSRARAGKMVLEANAVSLISLNKKWYETDSYKDVREIDILEDKKGEDPTRRIQKNDLMRLVTKGLNRNERLIIILYYYEELTMKEIGATLDLSESRVSQMHGHAFAARASTELRVAVALAQGAGVDQRLVGVHPHGGVDVVPLGLADQRVQARRRRSCPRGSAFPSRRRARIREPGAADCGFERRRRRSSLLAGQQLAHFAGREDVLAEAWGFLGCGSTRICRRRGASYRRRL